MEEVSEVLSDNGHLGKSCSTEALDLDLDVVLVLVHVHVRASS